MATPIISDEKTGGFKTLELTAQLDQIVTFLRQQQGEVKTLAIAKQFCGPSATCKNINPLLYKLLVQKRVTKVAEENGANPRWKAV